LVSLSSNNDARSVACSKTREMTERTMNSIQWCETEGVIRAFDSDWQ
jgi:hypothetical protein